ncbi:MAG: hypothetical protein KDA96_04705 [Planctomycetaceae bacterium]|nr:hypothetical protein [Planctomycetaceae bacterium]
MNGQLAELIASSSSSDRAIVRSVFEEQFQDIRTFRSFLKSALNDRVNSMLSSPLDRWTVRSFQALFIACWVHHPVEKGSFMINLAGLPEAQRDVIQSAVRARLKSRASSHLSKQGYSASSGWAFLKGYAELLVQYETIGGGHYLFLKAEGHTTGLGGIIPHLRSWHHKNKTGEGLTASPALNTLASAGNPMVTEDGRAAENYASGYKKLVKQVLGLKGTTLTVRDVIPKLYEYTKYEGHGGLSAGVNGTSNQNLGVSLSNFCKHVEKARTNPARPGRSADTRLQEITDDMLKDLKELARQLREDGSGKIHRIYKEIHAKPAELDSSLDVFYAK